MEYFKLGVDLGRSEIRLHDGTTTAFPALLGGPVTKLRRRALSPEEFERNLSVRYGEKTYSLGRLSLHQPFLFPLGVQDFASELNLVLLLGALGLYAQQQGAQEPHFELCLGVPVALSQHQATLDELEAWQTTHSIELSGTPMEIHIDKIEWMSQPLGSLYTALLNGQLDLDPEEDPLVGILDLGYASASWMIAQLPEELPQYSGCLTSIAGGRLLDALSQELPPGTQLNPLAALQALQTGIYGNLEIPQAPQEELLDLMAQQIALTVRQRWADLPLRQILVTGGLGERLFERLQQTPFLSEAILSENPREANVIGFHEYLHLDEASEENEESEEDEIREEIGEIGETENVEEQSVEA
ncbi:MAG: hypothetical protein ACM3YO_04955 [Bacteroidota bacterium]